MRGVLTKYPTYPQQSTKDQHMAHGTFSRMLQHMLRLMGAPMALRPRDVITVLNSDAAVMAWMTYDGHQRLVSL